MPRERSHQARTGRCGIVSMNQLSMSVPGTPCQDHRVIGDRDGTDDAQAHVTSVEFPALDHDADRVSGRLVPFLLTPRLPGRDGKPERAARRKGGRRRPGRRATAVCFLKREPTVVLLGREELRHMGAGRGAVGACRFRFGPPLSAAGHARHEHRRSGSWRSPCTGSCGRCGRAAGRPKGAWRWRGRRNASAGNGCSSSSTACVLIRASTEARPTSWSSTSITTVTSSSASPRASATGRFKRCYTRWRGARSCGQTVTGAGPPSEAGSSARW